MIAPVGGEVILLAGICGEDGYLVTGAPIEWMVSPDSVGNIIQIGDDDRCKLHKLVSDRTPTGKVDGDFARGRTTTKATLITRGTRNLRDDVALKKGEAWISLSSPSEGVSRVTVLAPESDCWDNRKATTTIYWIDANWEFPQPVAVAAGRPAQLITRVTRSEATIPATGWIVRYEMLTPTLGGFAPNGASVVEVPVNAQGEAPVTVLPAPNTSGTASIEIQVIRPAESDLPRMVLKRGQALVTWSAPKLTLRAQAATVAGFDQPIVIQGNVSNPGDMPAENVSIEVGLPPGVTFVSSDLKNENFPNRVNWPIGNLPPRMTLDFTLTVRARNPFRLTYVARGSNVPAAEATVAVDVYQPSLEVRVQPVQDRLEVGQEATFDIEVRNIGSRPISRMRLTAESQRGLNHLETGKNVVVLDYDQPALQAGQTWGRSITFRVVEPGKQCIRITASGDAAQQATNEACIIATNPPVPTPSATARIVANPDQRIGEVQTINMYVSNNGRVPLNNVRVVATYDARVNPQRGTTGADTSAMDRYQVFWTIPRLDPGPEQLFQSEVRAIGPAGESVWLLTVESAERAEASDRFNIRILPGSLQPNNNPPPNIGVDNRVMPPGANGGLGNAAGTLQVSISDRNDPVTVQENITYFLTLQNARDTLDDTVQVRVQMPEGFEPVSVRQTNGGTPQQPRILQGNILELPVINTIRARETLTFEMVFRSNLPRRVTVSAEVTSRLNPQPVVATTETEIVPR